MLRGTSLGKASPVKHTSAQQDSPNISNPASLRPPTNPTASHPPVLATYHRRPKQKLTTPSLPITPNTATSTDIPTPNTSMSTLDHHHDPHPSPPKRTHPMTLRPRKQANNVVTHSSLPHHIIPTCASQALQVPEWRETMSVEFYALVKQGTWELVPAQPGQNVVGCKWVYTVKYKSDGSIP
ncbi:unnamed protein product [Cuscuta epithymum]|uniref:Mitochondrial protein n=1 Tax=Cuscuta epithymum TaxID=186058 RepID=A0AAV0D402_9ASTE|nr:unnamed protein product [Cuscuta epithymum]